MNAKRARTVAVVAPLACAIVGNALTGNALTRWYPRLRKSRWVLPLWAFIPVEVAYYVMCRALLYRLLALVPPSPARGRAIALLLAMMGANEGWNYLFFGRKDLRAGFAGMLGFVGLTVALYRALERVDGRTATILRPYLSWLGYDVV